jgi:hypothetical protein
MNFRCIDGKGPNAKVQQKLPPGSLLLLDGQQRTLAMCIGWPWKGQKEMDKRIWVDFGKSALTGQPFQLRLTTQCHPFGFNPSDHSKLSRHDRREARKKFDAEAEHCKLSAEPDYKLCLDETCPYGAIYPLELSGLIREWRDAAKDKDAWSEKVLMNLRKYPLPKEFPSSDVAKRIRDFGLALERLDRMEIALVSVAQHLVEQDAADGDDTSEPSLIILFNRLANAGAPLSRADYVFSLIKHRLPEAHDLVQQLHGAENVGSLLSANELVMTAVRIAANTNQLTDIPMPNPREFGRILRTKVSAGAGRFLEDALKPLIEPGGPTSLHKAFRETQRLLAFRKESPRDPGLPILAFPLLQRQLVQVLVFWIHCRHLAITSEEYLEKRLEASRSEILRFVLFWLLCVGDREKDKEAASKCAFSILRGEHESFPGRAIYKGLCDEKLAVPLLPPNAVKIVALSPTGSPPDAKPIRSWESRFGAREDSPPAIQGSRQLYVRWFHRRQMLLWLQRKTLVVEFRDANPLAGRDEETPYDYDHICPWADWGADYRSFRSPLKYYCEQDQAWVVGNCIGNFRIEESSSNRINGDSSPKEKLKLAEIDSQETQDILMKSAITPDEAIAWRNCSYDDTNKGEWNEGRAVAFREVVEERAFRLFKQYFEESGFDAGSNAWVPSPGSNPEI